MDSSERARIVGSDMTVADKIRALDAAGLARAEIARLLHKRYQHVRNVLEADKLRRPPAQASGVAEVGPAFRHSPGPAAGSGGDADVERRGSGVFRLAVREDGSVVLPREVREAFGLAGRGVVMARLEGEEFKLISAAAALRRIREKLRPYMQEGVSWADEMIAQRRREAEREAADD